MRAAVHALGGFWIEMDKHHSASFHHRAKIDRDVLAAAGTEATRETDTWNWKNWMLSLSLIHTNWAQLWALVSDLIFNSTYLYRTNSQPMSSRVILIQSYIHSYHFTSFLCKETIKSGIMPPIMFVFSRIYFKSFIFVKLPPCSVDVERLGG